MTRLQQLFTDLQRELVVLGKIPATVTAGSIQLDVNETRLASVRPTYYAKIVQKELPRCSSIR
jgi:hypothetical protein